MPRLTRQPLVTLLAALAALLAPVGATAAGSVAAAVRQAVVGGSAGAVHATSQPPAGRSEQRRARTGRAAGGARPARRRGLVGPPRLRRHGAVRAYDRDPLRTRTAGARLRLS